jgi:hypothetical protein
MTTLTREARAYLLAHGFSSIDEAAAKAGRPTTGHEVDFSGDRWEMRGGGDNVHIEFNSNVNPLQGAFDDFFLAMELVPHGWARARLGDLRPEHLVDPHLRYHRMDNPTMLVRGRFEGSPHRVVSARRRARGAALVERSYSDVVADLGADLAAAGLGDEVIGWAKVRVANYFVALLSNVRAPTLRASLGGDIDLRPCPATLGPVERLRLWEGMGWSPYGKPSADAIAAAEHDLGVDLPDDYRSLLSSCRGGTIRGAHAVVELWAIDELALLTEERGDAIPDVMFFASDGGDRVYFFDPTGRLGRGRFAVFMVEGGVLTEERSVHVGDSFSVLVDRVLGGERLDPSDGPREVLPIEPVEPWPHGLSSAWQWIPNDAGAPSAIDSTEAAIGVAFPDRWRRLWTSFDGGRLRVGDARASLWCMRGLGRLSADHEWRSIPPGLVPFGGDGGELLLLADPRDAYGQGEWAIFVVDQADPLQPMKFIAPNIEVLLARLVGGRSLHD